MKQKKKSGRKVISCLLALVMVFSTMTGIVPGMSLTAYADSYNGKTTYLSGKYYLRDGIENQVSVGAVYSQNCRFNKPNRMGFTLYDMEE